MSYMAPRPEGMNTDPAPPSVVETMSSTTALIEAYQTSFQADWNDPAMRTERDLFTKGWYAAQSAGQEAVAWPILKGVGKIDGDGWKDTTKVGQIVYVWNAELPAPNMEGQFPRIGNEIWSASTKQYDFTPATMEEIRDFFTTHFASVNGGEREKVARDAAVCGVGFLMVTPDGEKRLSPDEVYLRNAAPVNGGERASPAKVGGDEREAFEAWARTKHMPLCVIGQQYDDYWTDNAWNGWQARAALSADNGERKDAERLDFLIDQQAWVHWHVRDDSIRQCRFYSQDEDENYHVLSGEDRFFNTSREAIDAAIAAKQSGKGGE